MSCFVHYYLVFFELLLLFYYYCITVLLYCVSNNSEEGVPERLAPSECCKARLQTGTVKQHHIFVSLCEMEDEEWLEQI